MEIEIETFEAISDNGRRYRIRILQDQVNASTLAKRKFMPGMKRVVLDDGSAVNRIDEEAFEIVATHEIIRRVDD